MRVVRVVLCVVLVLLLCSCGYNGKQDLKYEQTKNEPLTESESKVEMNNEDTDDVLGDDERSDPVGEETDTEAEPETEDAEVPPTEEGIERFLAPSYGDHQGFYLKKGDSLYTLSNIKSLNNNAYYYYIQDSGDQGWFEAFEYTISCDKSTVVPSVDQGDSIIYYSAAGVAKLELYKAEFSGYTINAVSEEIGSGCYQFKMYADNRFYQSVRTDHYEVKICDENENPVEDRFSMEKGKTYTVYWYEGTQYNEVKMTADYPYYTAEPEASYVIEGALTKDGYAVYDLTGVPAGLYLISNVNNGLIYIQ